MRSIISKNKIYIIVCFTTMLVMLLTALNDTNIFYIVIKFITNQSFRENYTLAESNIKYNISLYSVIVQILTEYTWNYNIMLIWALNIFQIFVDYLKIRMDFGEDFMVFVICFSFAFV